VEVTTRDLDPPETPARAERELLALSMARVWGPGETPDISERLGVLDKLAGRGEAAGAALAGLAAEWHREHADAFGPFDGVLAADDILEDLCERIPGRLAMSARRLERFGGCPFAFLAGELLGLEPVEEPSRDLGPLDVGLIYHAVLEQFFSALIASGEAALRLTEANRAAAQALLADVAAACFARLEAQGRVGSPALWKVQRRKVLRDLAALVDWHVNTAEMAAWRPAHTEVSFGAPAGAAVEPPGFATAPPVRCHGHPAHDSRAGSPCHLPQPEPGRREPLVFKTPHGDLRLRGRIDRIDRAAEGDGWQVVDYKSGRSAPTPARRKAGASFQLPVYLWAAEELLGTPAEGVMQAFFLPIRQPQRTDRLTSEATKTAPGGTVRPALDLARRYIENFVEAMRQGQFPVYPRVEGGCAAHCPFQEICRYAEWRIRRKAEAHPIPPLAVLDEEAKKTPGVVSPKGPQGAAQKRHLVSFSPETEDEAEEGGP
jgi:RecB family exonuclease